MLDFLKFTFSNPWFWLAIIFGITNYMGYRRSKDKLYLANILVVFLYLAFVIYQYLYRA